MIITGDCREVLAEHGPFDMIIADPPYGDTSLAWDKRVMGWEAVARRCLKPTGSMWVFGSMRSLLLAGPQMADAGWRYAQDIVWEKHNGSGSHADRFKRVHEHAVQFYAADAPWEGVWNEVQTTADAVAKVIPRRQKPTHWGHVEPSTYRSEAGGDRLMRSVITMRSCHGHAIHPTEKPVGVLEILIRTSCPPGGLVADFFAGSGSAGEAAALGGRRYIGAETDPDMAEAARGRLAGNLFAGTAA